MRFHRSIEFAAVIAIWPASLFCGQSSSRAEPFLIEPNRPMVYLHVDHIGLAKSAEGGNLQQRVWLELHNNCRLPVKVRSFGESPGDPPGAVGVMDELVADPIIRTFSQEERRKLGPTKMPQDTSMDVGSASTVAPGDKLMFSLPATHFSKRWDIHIPFWFSLPPGKGPRDEDAWGGNVQMFLTYSFYDLPTSMQRILQPAIPK